jgi:hypothetical protein
MRRFLQHVKGLLAILRLQDRITLYLEQLGQGLSHGAIIVHQH